MRDKNESERDYMSLTKAIVELCFDSATTSTIHLITYEYILVIVGGRVKPVALLFANMYTNITS